MASRTRFGLLRISMPSSTRTRSAFASFKGPSLLSIRRSRTSPSRTSWATSPRSSSRSSFRASTMATNRRSPPSSTFHLSLVLPALLSFLLSLATPRPMSSGRRSPRLLPGSTPLPVLSSAGPALSSLLPLSSRAPHTSTTRSAASSLPAVVRRLSSRATALDLPRSRFTAPPVHSACTTLLSRSSRRRSTHRLPPST